MFLRLSQSVCDYGMYAFNSQTLIIINRTNDHILIKWVDRYKI